MPDRDSVVYAWTVERDDGERRTIRVTISETALASDGLPDPLPEVIGSKGGTAVIGVAHWRDPPEVVTVDSMSVRPFPGSPDPAAEAH